MVHKRQSFTHTAPRQNRRAHEQRKDMLYLPLSSVCAAATAGLAERTAAERDDAMATRSCRKPAARSLDSDWNPEASNEGREESKQGSSSKGRPRGVPCGEAPGRSCGSGGEAPSAGQRRAWRRRPGTRAGGAAWLRCLLGVAAAHLRKTGEKAGAGYRKERLPSKALEQIIYSLDP